MQYAVSVPEKFKKNNRLYREFQIQLSESCAKIPDASLGISAFSNFYTMKYALRKYAVTLPNPVKTLVKGVLGRNNKTMDNSQKEKKLSESFFGKKLINNSILGENQISP